MGTLQEWTHVLTTALLMGALWFGIQKLVGKPGKNFKHAIQGAVLFGTMFGLVDTFGLRLLRWPLVLVSAIFFLGLFLLRRSHTRTTTEADLTKS